jgi:hypothetical protein
MAEKKYTFKLTETERNTLLDCVRATERICDNEKRNSLLPEIRAVSEFKQKEVFKVWEKIEHQKPEE